MQNVGGKKKRTDDLKKKQETHGSRLAKKKEGPLAKRKRELCIDG